ncbi:MAG TPA: helix-turn-helix domain-containing protein [Candidatus Cybelea sp.]|jgi:transcriptional regulator with XRE-family HTH domain
MISPSPTGTVGGIDGAGIAVETRREALGRFLRERRESLAPEQVGIASHRGRRTPGLRREEVAFLADIGVKWYARLEAGDEINPSAATLAGIAVALRLSAAELEYLLNLAGLRQPLFSSPDTETMPDPLAALISRSHGIAVKVGDRVLTPILWNTLADAIYGYSAFEDPIERNSLVRALYDPVFIAFLGAEREQLIFNAVGMFRLNYTSPSPSPFTAALYERVKDHPLFTWAWKRRVISNELTSSQLTVREHALVGRLNLYAADFNTPMRSDLFVRMNAPADDQTAAKFARLEQAAHEKPDFARPRLTVESAG